MPQDICVPCNPFFYCSFLCLHSLYCYLFNSLFFFFLVILYYYYIILILDFWLWAAGNKTGMDSRADKRLTRRRRSNRPYTSSEDQVWYTNIINLICRKIHNYYGMHSWVRIKGALRQMWSPFTNTCSLIFTLWSWFQVFVQSMF